MDMSYVHWIEKVWELSSIVDSWRFGILTNWALLTCMEVVMANLFILYQDFSKTILTLNLNLVCFSIQLWNFTHHKIKKKIKFLNFLFCFVFIILCPTHRNVLNTDWKTSSHLLVNSASSGQILQQLCPPYQYI